MNFIYTKLFKRTFLIFVIVCFFIILQQSGVAAKMRDGMDRVFGKLVFQTRRVSSHFSDFFRTFPKINSLAKENALLNLKINELSFENARLKAAKEENVVLRRALQFKNEDKMLSVSAEVTMLDSTGFEQNFIINRGTEDQIKEGYPVVVSPGIIVGIVKEVRKNSATVMMITDPQAKVDGLIAETGAKGLIQGDHGLGLSFNLVTQNEVVKVGDLVITSGLSENIPRGLLIGEVVSIQSSTSELFQKTNIRPVADLRNLEFVFVVLGKQQ
jgi:rod shape-determining protein MreC